jgi:hypothetical protein
VIESALLYHCLPRRSTDIQIKTCGYARTDANTIGREILFSIFDYGLLLTPEELSIPIDPGSKRTPPPGPLKITQRRACFTLLRFEELFSSAGQESGTPSHVGAFGDFAIGLDAVEARLLGVMPTFYYYRILQNPESFGINLPTRARDRDLSAFGPSSELLFRLAELRSLLVSLAYIEAIGAPEGRAVYRTDRLLRKRLVHNPKFEPDVLNALGKLSRSKAKTIYSCIDTDRMPAWNLIEWLDILLNAFQIADSRQSISSFEYYQQREWRVIQLHSPFFDCYPLRSPPDLPDWPRGKQIDALYSLVMSHSGAQGFRFDPENTFLLTAAAGRRFRSFIREVVVPADLANEVEAKLRKIGVLQGRARKSISTHGERTYARLVLKA